MIKTCFEVAVYLVIFGTFFVSGGVGGGGGGLVVTYSELPGKFEAR